MDPLANMFTNIVNASRAGHPRVLIPYSKFHMDIARALQAQGYVKDVTRRGKKNKRVIDIVLRYGTDAAIHAISLLSKQSARRYAGWRDMKRFRTRRGIVLVSTSKGIMPHKEAEKEKIGGEVIAQVW